MGITSETVPDVERPSTYFCRAPDLDFRFSPIIHSTNDLHVVSDKNLTITCVTLPSAPFALCTSATRPWRHSRTSLRSSALRTWLVQHRPHQSTSDITGTTAASHQHGSANRTWYTTRWPRDPCFPRFALASSHCQDQVQTLSAGSQSNSWSLFFSGGWTITFLQCCGNVTCWKDKFHMVAMTGARMLLACFTGQDGLAGDRYVILTTSSVVTGDRSESGCWTTWSVSQWWRVVIIIQRVKWRHIIYGRLVTIWTV